MERRDANFKLKRRLIEDIAHREMEYVSHQHDSPQSSPKAIRLERALELAFEWQNTQVPNYEQEVNERVYYGPLKWIVCLLGDDVYSISQFRMKNRERLARQQNMSISIMALSAEPKDRRYSRCKEYRELAELTAEGLFVNVVSKESCDQVAARFFSSMEVYPIGNSTHQMREFFGAF